MPIDLYALCPCGSGKKIKFCCRDLAGEIEKIERLREADQRLACLEHIEILEKKYPNRAYLMTTKAELLRELGRDEDADGTIRGLLEQDQENPVALAESALLALSQEEEGVLEAIDRLQRVIEVTPRDPWPEKVKEAIAAVSDECFSEGYLLACLAHMVLFLESDPENEGAAVALGGFAESAQVPLLCKELRPFKSCAKDAPWKDEFNQAMSLADRCLWRRAEKQLSELGKRPEAENDPAIWHNLGVLYSWLADDDDAAGALEILASLDIPLDEAVEAQALAVEIDPGVTHESVEEVKVTYPIRDMDRVIEASISHDRLVDVNIPIAGSEDQPAPKSTHLLLDRAKPDAEAEVSVDSVPRIIGYVFIFGKQTDREARLELFARRDEALQANKDGIAEVFADTVGESEEEKLQDSPYVPFWDSYESWLPTGTPTDKVRELRMQLWRRHLFDVWPKRPWNYLDDKTPEEAAKDPLGQIKLLGFLLYIELSSQRNRASEFDFNALRRHLGLPEAGPVDPDQVDLRDVPLARLSRLQMDKLSDDFLLGIFARAAHYRAAAAAQRAALEVVSRESLDEKIDKAGMYATLAHLSDDSRKALDYVDQARQIAEEAGASSATYDIHELTLRMRRGEGKDVSRLIDHVMDEHINEPGVRQSMRDIFIQLGMLNPDGSTPQRPEPEDVAAAASESAEAESPTIWTPDGDQPASGEKPKILLPE